MRLVTHELATPMGPARRLGLWRPEAVLDLNLAYTGLLARGADPVFAAAYAAVVLPPDMLGFLRAGEAGRSAATDLACRWQGEGELEVEGLAILRNRVVKPGKRRP